jgi:iron only hydrogenase large subunit-like protein
MRENIFFTIDEDKCVNCHQCIAACSTKFANNGINDVIEVLTELCIGCGECIKACSHDARIPIDDFDSAMIALEQKEKVIAIVAPAVASNFPNQHLNLNGWLKSKGVEAIFDVSFGAELTVKSYVEHIQQNNPKLVIAQPCPALVRYIQIYKPELIPYLAPADSPMVHIMKMIKHFYPAYKNHKILVVSPCVAKKIEFEETGIGDFNVTISKIQNHFIENNINLESFPKVDFDNDPAERAVLFSSPGGLIETAERMVPGIRYQSRKIEGPHSIYKYLGELNIQLEKGMTPLLVDCLNCELGCNGGTGTNNHDKSLDELEYYINQRKVEAQNKHKTVKNNDVAIVQYEQLINKYWEKGLYDRKYEDLSSNTKIIKIPTENQLQEIYFSMNKHKESDHKNCSSCGYDSCEIMATAIFNKLNKNENCHHFLHEELNDKTEEVNNQKDEIITNSEAILSLINKIRQLV